MEKARQAVPGWLAASLGKEHPLLHELVETFPAVTPNKETCLHPEVTCYQFCCTRDSNSANSSKAQFRQKRNPIRNKIIKLRSCSFPRLTCLNCQPNSATDFAQRDIENARISLIFWTLFVVAGDSLQRYLVSNCKSSFTVNLYKQIGNFKWSLKAEIPSCRPKLPNFQSYPEVIIEKKNLLTSRTLWLSPSAATSIRPSTGSTSGTEELSIKQQPEQILCRRVHLEGAAGLVLGRSGFPFHR